jgi:hypothetical protein
MSACIHNIFDVATPRDASRCNVASDRIRRFANAACALRRAISRAQKKILRTL